MKRLLVGFSIVVASACAGSPTSPEDAEGDGGGGPGGDSEPGFNNTTTFHGVVAGGDGRSGIIEITIQALIASGTAASSIQALHAAPNDISGSLTLNQGGGRIDLAGQHDHSGSRVTLTGGGYTFDGMVRPDGILEGTYRGPSQSGGFSMLDSGTSFVTSYCGHFGSEEPDDHGIWSVALPSSDGSMSGVAVQDGSRDCVGPPLSCPPTSPNDPDIIQITGSRTGNGVRFTLTDGGSGSGSVDSETVSGNWNDGTGETGTFSGSTVGCQ
jgi:hypothetical protein